MKVNLMHGAGGEVMGELLQIITNLKHTNAGGIGLESLDDGAVIPMCGQNVVFTTDSHVVSPIFFPGGDIGRIAVCGTINDLAMMGGRPIALSCGMVIPEGFEVADFERIVASMDIALGECGANLVTGDTKVLERGALDTIIINTAGIGVADRVVRDNGLLPGDAIVVSGTIGDHGIAIMAHREGFDFGGQIRSDVAPLWMLVERALAAGDIHAMKDPTRGGFANAINEMAKKERRRRRHRRGSPPFQEERQKRRRHARHRSPRGGKRGKGRHGGRARRCGGRPRGAPVAPLRPGRGDRRQGRRRFPRGHADRYRRRAVHRTTDRRPGPARLLAGGHTYFYARPIHHAHRYAVVWSGMLI